MRENQLHCNISYGHMFGSRGCCRFSLSFAARSDTNPIADTNCDHHFKQNRAKREFEMK